MTKIDLENRIKELELELDNLKSSVIATKQENKTLLLNIAENYPNSFVTIIEKDFTIGFSAGQEFINQNLNPKDFIGLTLEQVFGDKTHVVEEYYKNTFNGKEQSFELFINEQYQQYRTVPLYDNEESVTRILVVVENITKRKLSEEKLLATKEKAEESETLLNETGAIAKVGGWKINLSTQHLFWSKEVFNIHEVSDDFEPTVEKGVNFYSNESKEIIEKAINDAIALSKPFDVSLEIVTAKGNLVNVRALGKVQTDNKGVPLYIIGAFQDITEKFNYEQSLKFAKEKAEESEANISAIIEGTNNSIWAFNRNYETLYINKTFQQEFLQSFGVLLEVGTNLVEALPESLQPFWKSRYDRVLTNEQYTLEDAIPTDNGTIYIDVSFNPIVKNGQVIGGSCFGSNITSRKVAELELLKAKEKAEESDRLKSAFLSNMSHEIRTPMNGILGFSELLNEPDLSSEEQQSFIEVIQRSGDRMLSTINNIIDISKIESGMMNVNIQEFNINEKMEFNYNFFNLEAERKDILLSCKNGLPDKEANIKTDNEKVNGILTNLIKNAIKFTNDGSIDYGYKKKGEYLEFFVKDTGIGIPKHNLQSVFERFRQVDESNSRLHEGSGLGLSISKSYLEMLGGKMWLESEEGKGSAFYFTIPYNPVSE